MTSAGGFGYDVPGELIRIEGFPKAVDASGCSCRTGPRAAMEHAEVQCDVGVRPALQCPLYCFFDVGTWRDERPEKLSECVGPGAWDCRVA